MNQPASGAPERMKGLARPEVRILTSSSHLLMALHPTQPLVISGPSELSMVAVTSESSVPVGRLLEAALDFASDPPKGGRALFLDRKKNVPGSGGAHF